MATQIYVNLPVKHLQRSQDFFASMGYSFEPRFTDENAACLIIDENIYVMLLSEPFFKGSTPKQVADASKTTEVLMGISAECRERVDERVGMAVGAGGRQYSQPKDYGFMYQHGFEDLDGHMWELVWMDPNADPAEIAAAGADASSEA